jgi:hypothetical protein
MQRGLHASLAVKAGAVHLRFDPLRGICAGIPRGRRILSGAGGGGGGVLGGAPGPRDGDGRGVGGRWRPMRGRT